MALLRQSARRYDLPARWFLHLVPEGKFLMVERDEHATDPDVLAAPPSADDGTGARPAWEGYSPDILDAVLEP
jgi:hypothetical protein